MTDLREQITEIVREAIHAGHKEPPAEHYVDRIFNVLMQDEDPEEYARRMDAQIREAAARRKAITDAWLKSVSERKGDR